MAEHRSVGRPPTVSVIVPVHNVEATLDECLTSIAGQSHTHLDIIVVDDGSTDASPEICRSWAIRDSRIRVLTTHNRGSSSARQSGLGLARGEFVTFVDSDDVLQPDLISVLVGVAADHDTQIAVCSYSSFSDAPPDPPVPPYRVSVQPAIAALRQIICVKPQWEVWGKLYERQLWDEVQFPCGRVGEDLAVIPLVFSHATRIALVETPLYAYRVRSGSVMDGVRRRGPSIDLLTMLEDNIRFARAQAIPANDRDAFIGAYVMHASKQLENLGHGHSKMNPHFVRAYKQFAARHRHDVARCGAISTPYRLLRIISSYSPATYSTLMRLARALKQNGWNGLSRASGRTRQAPT